MTDETQLKIYGLIDVAREQQAELSAAIQALKAEREALRAEVSATVRQSLAGASQTAATALETATAPLLNRLTGVTTAAEQAEGKLRNAGAWFAWKWVAVALGGLAGVCLVADAPDRKPQRAEGRIRCQRGLAREARRKNQDEQLRR